MDRSRIVVIGGGLLLLAVAGGSLAYALTQGRSPSTARATPSPTYSLPSFATGQSTPTPDVTQAPVARLSTLNPAPSPRSGASIAYDAQHKDVVLFGGGNGNLNDTWTWDGVQWTKKSPANSPSPRYNAAMAYDAGRGLVVLFGGRPYFSDTWTWDGNNWVQMITAASPPPLDSPSTMEMDYDAATNRVVLFMAGKLLNEVRWVTETWTWDGTTWAQLNPVASPTFPNGTFFSMAYYPPTSSMILLAESSATWSFNGTNWTQLSTGSTVTSRIEADMAYDARDKTLVLFGGQGSPGPALNDTWRWNGSAWSQLTPATSPPKLWATGLGPSMAADAAAGIMLFGGEAGGGTSNVLWEWDGTTWQRVEPATYATALDAGIAGAKARTGLGYGTCTTSPCLTGSTVVGNTDPGVGWNAAYVHLTMGSQPCLVYVYRDSAGWHVVNAACPQQAGLSPVLGATDTVRVSGGCANLRSSAGLGAGVVGCLTDGTIVNIDSVLPRYVDGHIWWSLNNGKGWMAHDFLVSS